MDKRYYKITGGIALERTVAFFNERHEQLKARKAIIQELGAKGEYSNDNGISGLVFDEPPQGWRPITGTIYKPPLTKEGKALTKRLKSLRVSGGREFHVAINGGAGGFGFMDFTDAGMVISYIVYEKIGPDFILIVPDEPDEARQWNPPDSCEPLKTSEYWQLKEAAPNEAEK
jgi:hypothetical protein